MKTYMASNETADRQWCVVDADNKVLGRLASEIAKRLRGKHKPEFTPHADVGDYIVVINADKIAVTGKKREDKVYHRHTQYPGGLKSQTLEKLLDTHPTRAIEKAVKGMLPKGPLGRDMYRKLKVYAGPSHPHAAQLPRDITQEV